MRLAQEDSPHVIGRTDADGVDPNYDLEDHASRFSLAEAEGNYALILRLSAAIKDPTAGFVFGRNALRCDVVFVKDPLKRISNVHFRIYVNKHGSVMIEDQSTNGTVVDENVLTSHPKDPTQEPVPRWMLNSGSVIKVHLHQQVKDLTFRVRIPRRDAEYDMAYMNKVREYFERHGLDDEGSPEAAPAVTVPRHLRDNEATPKRPHRSPVKRKDTGVMRREWTGSGKYNRIGTIGKGAFAVVYKVASKYDGSPYAAKELDKQRFMKNGVVDQKAENEMKIMQCIDHVSASSRWQVAYLWLTILKSNIVRYIETIDWDDRLLIIIMEYVSGGDLGRHISERGPLPEGDVKLMAGQLVDALSYLHVRNITHRDVKPDNILISSLDPLVVKLTDFGLSKMVDSEQTFLRTFCGTLLYCAPEVYTEYAEYDEHGVRNRGKKVRRPPGQRYNHAVDIWSLAGVLFYTMTGAPPYPVKTGISHSELLHMIMTTYLDTRPLQVAGMSHDGIHFLTRMLDRLPEKRATIHELVGHPWLTGPVSESVQASQSFDELTDDENEVNFDNEDLDMDLDTFRQPTDDIYEEDRISDSIGYDSEKENGQFEEPRQGARLFGEVGSSAIGSSGVIPSDLLNLHRSNDSMRETEIMDSYVDEAYDSESHPTPRNKSRQLYQQTSPSMAQNQSADQLDSLVYEVASQSLGGKDHPAASVELRAMSFKRKPPSTETSGEHDDENLTPGKPTMKRLKSETTLESMSDDVLEELKLIASIPPIKRLHSGRQIDSAVNKVVFWAQDRKTWHLDYPEMTQLQKDAFVQAAERRGEEFCPGGSPLWKLAMKYFAPMTTHEASQGRGVPTMRRNEQMLEDESMLFPPTAAATEPAAPSALAYDSLPPTQNPDGQIVVPVQAVESSQRAIALLESTPDSVIQGVSLPVTNSLISFGRGQENTQVFEPPTESRVPKYAFKILLWKDGYDPSKDPTKVTPPWQQATIGADEADQYSFWICTKATVGIQINGYQLASSDNRNHAGPSQFWARLHDRDELVIWGAHDTDNHTKLVFRCFWGGSSQPRPAQYRGFETASKDVLQKLNDACQLTERRMRDTREKDSLKNEATKDHVFRNGLVERERERSRAFDKKRQEAVELLKQAQFARRGSPASVTSTGHFRTPHGASSVSQDRRGVHSIR